MMKLTKLILKSPIIFSILFFLNFANAKGNLNNTHDNGFKWKFGIGVGIGTHDPFIKTVGTNNTPSLGQSINYPFSKSEHLSGITKNLNATFGISKNISVEFDFMETTINGTEEESHTIPLSGRYDDGHTSFTLTYKNSNVTPQNCKFKFSYFSIDLRYNCVNTSKWIPFIDIGIMNFYKGNIEYTYGFELYQVSNTGDYKDDMKTRELRENITYDGYIGINFGLGSYVKLTKNLLFFFELKGFSWDTKTLEINRKLKTEERIFNNIELSGYRIIGGIKYFIKLHK